MQTVTKLRLGKYAGPERDLVHIPAIWPDRILVHTWGGELICLAYGNLFIILEHSGEWPYATMH